MKLVEMKISELFKVVPLDKLATKDEYEKYRNLVNSFKDIKNDLNCFNYFNIQIVVNNNDDLIIKANQIIEVLNKEQCCFLRVIYNQYEHDFIDEQVYVTLIRKGEVDIFKYNLYTELLKIANFIEDGKLNLKISNKKIEKMFKDNYQDITNLFKIKKENINLRKLFFQGSKKT